MGGLERGGQELRIDRAKPRARLRPERQSGDGAEVHDTPIYFSERSRLRTDSAWPSRTRSFGVRPPKFEFGVLSHSSGLAKNLPASARRSDLIREKRVACRRDGETSDHDAKIAQWVGRHQDGISDGISGAPARRMPRGGCS